jgi:hypothetical protein
MSSEEIHLETETFRENLLPPFSMYKILFHSVLRQQDCLSSQKNKILKISRTFSFDFHKR